MFGVVLPAVALLLGPATLVSQFPEPRFEHIMKARGLPNALIHCMLMDRQGFLWFGFEGALARYDRIQFMSVRLPNDRSLGATQNLINNCIESRNGILWCATIRGDPSLPSES